MAVGDLWELQINGRAAGGVIQNVLGFKFLTTAASGDGLANDWLTACKAGWLGNLSAGYTLENVTAVNVTPGTAASVQVTPTGTVIGSGTGDMLPPSNCMVATLTTALKGRAYRGRQYVSPWPEAAQNNGTFLSGYVNGLATGYMDVLMGRYAGGGVSADYRLVIISRQLNGATRPTPVGTDVLFYVVRPIVHLQRRRTVGYGS